MNRRDLFTGFGALAAAASPEDLLELFSSLQISRLPVTNFMPSEGEPFDFANYITIPAISPTVFTPVVQFLVPPGSNGMVKRIANEFVGPGFVNGSGDIVWQIFLDFTSQVVVPNYDNITSSLGLVLNPTVTDGIRVREGQLVTLAVRNNAIAPGAEFIGGRLGGYFYPKEFDAETAGF